MFIIILTYKKSLSDVERHLEAHRNYLDKNYATKTFIASGRQEPRVGGVILCRAESRVAVETIIKTDPFYINEVADYNIIEFCPTKHLQGFEEFM